MIQRELILTVNNTTASFNEPLQIYQYDRGIALKIQVLKYKYKFDKVVQSNVVIDDRIISARALVLKPDGKTAFECPRQEVEDDCVIINILLDWTNEQFEIGKYKLQIQLYGSDYVKERVTLPPVDFTVAPLIGFVPEEGVDLPATIDVSLVDESTIAEEGAAYSSDVANKVYDKTVWNTGDIITSSGLNNMEDAIEYLVENQGEVNLEDYYAKSQIDDFLSNKIDKSHAVILDSLSMGRKDDTYVGANSIASGYNATASGSYSFASGYNATASGISSHAEGTATTASGSFSHAEGYGTDALSSHQHVQGKYNIKDENNKYAHIVGNGDSNSVRSNAHTLDWNGNAWYQGNVSANGIPTKDNDLTTVSYVRTSIANAQLNGGNVDLSDYYTKSQVDKAISDAQFDDINLDDYALKAALNDYALKTELDLYALNSDLNKYALKDDLNDYALNSNLNDYALKTDVPTKTSQLTNDSNFMVSKDIKRIELVNEYPETQIAGVLYIKVSE